MSSTEPDRYMDANDIRMLRSVLKRAGYRLTDGELQKARRRDAAMFLIRQLGEGVNDPSSMLSKLEGQRTGTPRPSHPKDPPAWENKEGSINEAPGPCQPA